MNPDDTTITSIAFLEADLTGGAWRRLSSVETDGGALSWRVTTHELRVVGKVTGQGDIPTRFTPDAAAAVGAIARIVDIDAGALLRVQWSREQVDFDVTMDYGRGHSFGLQGAAVQVSAKAAPSNAQIWPAGGVRIMAGATIEPVEAGSSPYPMTRTKDTGIVGNGAGTDSVFVEVPPHARAFRWHCYQQSAPGAVALTFQQFDAPPNFRSRAIVNASQDPSTWPPGGWVPIVGTAKYLNVLNASAAITVALWLEFMLDIGG